MIKNTIIGIVISVSILLLVEIGLRIYWKVYYPQDWSCWRWSETSGFHYKPGIYDKSKSPIGFSGKVNSLGYRGEEWNLIKHDSVYRIICIGDSVVLGLGSSCGNDFPSLLQSTLGDDYEVYNAGLGANTSSQTLYRLKNEIVKYHPDLAIVSVGLNDMAENNPVFPKSYQTGGYLRKLTKNSYLIRVYAGLIYKVLLPKLPIRDKEYTPDLYQSNLNKIAGFCIDNDINLVFVTLPTLVHSNDISKVKYPYYANTLNKYKTLIDKYNNAIIRVGNDNRVTVVDMDKHFREIHKSSQYFLDNCHLTDKGNRLYADKVYNELFKR
jgi:lysophospholipase L1-like esterase